MEPTLAKFMWFVSTATLAVLAFFLKRFVESVDRLKESFEDFRLHVSDTFVTKTDYRAGMAEINDRIDEIHGSK